jgi:hypothetical protein
MLPISGQNDQPGGPQRSSAAAIVALAGGPASPSTISQAYARFSIDQETGMVSLTIVDAATNEVIRQVPSDEILELARQLQVQAERGGRAQPSGEQVVRTGQVDQRA